MQEFLYSISWTTWAIVDCGCTYFFIFDLIFVSIHLKRLLVDMADEEPGAGDAVRDEGDFQDDDEDN